MGGGALQRGHGAPLEALEQLGDTLGGVAAEAVNAEAAELVLGQAAKAKRGVSMGADRKANTKARVRGPCGLLEGSQRGVALEALGESGGSLGAEEVAVQTASTGAEGCQGALTQKRTLRSWFERRVAYLSDCSVELPLRPSAIAAPPSGPRWLCLRLRGVGSEMGGEPCQWALT